MQRMVPLQITYQGLAPSRTLDAAIRRGAARLEPFAGRIAHCNVVVDAAPYHDSSSQHCLVRVDIATPSGAIAVANDRPRRALGAEFEAAVIEAFESTVRELKEGETRSAEPS